MLKLINLLTLNFIFRDSESGVIEHAAGVLDASKCVETIIKRFEKLGGEFITGVKVKSVHPENNGFKLTTTKVLDF